MPKTWSKVHVSSSGKYKIRVHHDAGEDDLSVEYDSEEEANAAIEEFKTAPTNSKVITHTTNPKTW